MASNEQRDLEAVSQLVRATTENILKLEKASKGIAKNFAELAYQVKGQQRGMTEYLLSGIKLPSMLKVASQSLVTPMEELNALAAQHRDALAVANAQLAAEETALNKLHRNYTRKRAAQQQNVDAAKLLVKEAQAQVTLAEKQLDLKKQLARFTGSEIAMEYLVIKGFADAVKRSGELNQSLIEGNSAISARAALARETWEVMATTGNEQRDMMAAAKALVGVGFDLRSGYKDALTVLVQMEEGLGVSYENSAQLARIFEINLRTPVREVADKIAAIANQTSLAADEATRFATEIGKALRLLGPGAIQGSSAQVVGYMTAMAARMKDVGGDASEIVKAFQTLTKGTAEGFMLRGMAGVNRPGAMGTEAGSKAAMAGIDRMINQIVRSQPGTMAYTAELEIASQVLGISTESVRLWGEMMRKASAPLTENQKLQERWQEQISNANKALGRIKESTIALIQRAFNPLLEEVVTPMLNLIAKLVSYVASNKVMVIMTFVALTAAIAKTIWSLARLTVTLYQVSRAATAAALANAAGGGGGVGGLPKSLATQAAYGKLLQAIKANSVVGWVSRMAGHVGSLATKIPLLGGFLGKLSGMLGSWRLASSAANVRLWGLVGRLGASGPIAAVAAAGLVGYGLGKLIDKKWPDNPIALLARATGEAVAKYWDKANVKTAQLNKFQGDLTWPQLAAQMRQMVYQGRESDVEKHFMAQVHRIKGFESEMGGRTLLEVYKQTMAEAREKIGLASVTSAEEEVKNRDLKLIDLTRQGIENTGGSKKLLERAQEDRRAKLAEEKAQRDLAEKQRQTGQRIAPDPHAPTKPRYAIPGKLQ